MGLQQCFAKILTWAFISLSTAHHGKYSCDIIYTLRAYIGHMSKGPDSHGSSRHHSAGITQRYLNSA
jgi:hypothetical protein